MKNQYVGDINDYIKYSIIRQLAATIGGNGVMVCWMLTPDDGRTDGSLRGYLDAPERFRPFDPPVYDALAALRRGPRSVAAVESHCLIDTAEYFSGVLVDRLDARRAYFATLWRAVRPASLVFFDPDNGLGVPSVPKGRKNSAKYLYWDEFTETVRRGHSVVTYQHFPRVAREPYLALLLERVRQAAPGHSSCVVYGSRVAYVVSAGPHHALSLHEAASVIERQWKGVLRLAW